MATITGLKLTQLNNLALGSTGTRLYVVSAAGSSFQMYEKDLYTTLNTLHVSGAYQPKFEDWRFVHKSGAESITGSKTFVSANTFDGTTTFKSNMFISGYIGASPFFIQGVNPNSSILVPYGLLLATGANYSVSWSGRKLYTDQNIASNIGDISLDWNNRILSGNNWTKNFQYILTSADSGNLVVDSYSTGNVLNNRIISLSGDLYSTGNNLQTQVNTLTTNLYTTGLNSHNNSINLSGRLYTTGSTLDNKINSLSGYSDGFLVHKTGSETISGNKYFSAAGGLRVVGLNNGIADITVDPNNYTLIDNNPFTSVEWNAKQLLNGGNIRLDWDALKISGNWQVATSFLPTGLISPGTIGQLTISGSSLLVCTGSNTWGKISITPL